MIYSQMKHEHILPVIIIIIMSCSCATGGILTQRSVLSSKPIKGDVLAIKLPVNVRVPVQALALA